MIRNLFITLALFIVSTVGNSQQVNYKVLSNDSEIDPFVIVNLDLFQLDMGVNNLDGTSFNVGLWGIVEPVDRIGVDYSFKRSWLTLGQIGFNDYPSNTDVSLGGYFVFSKGTKERNKKVTLDMKYGGTTYSTNYKGERVSTRTETETYIMVPSSVYRQTGVRGGYYHKSGAFGMSDFEELPEDFEYAKISSNGFYGGVFLRRVINIFIDTDKYGVCFNSAGNDFYLDALLLPGQEFTNLQPTNPTNVDISSTVAEALGEGNIGFRFGYKIYQMEKKAKTGKHFGLSGMFEVGKLPYQGWFVNGGIGLTLVKFTK